MKNLLKIAEEFSPAPIGRYRSDSNKSGEAFRDDLLFPRIDKAIRENDVLVVDFEGMEGLTSSFLEEAFGGLISVKGLSAEAVIKALEFRPENSYFDPYIENVREYIRDAQDQQ
ncbi:MAG: STAS-like domain-containing protein [Candidatus Dadabacteria bacterium]|nr:STAS-like domain-containing protein [Candidatus Dadabacteria bacterium]